MKILKLNFQITYINQIYIPKKKCFKKWILIVLKNLRLNSDVTIRIVTKIEIKMLNKKYRKKNKVTNILSFSYSKSDKYKKYFLGDLVICGEKIQEEAIKQKKTIISHWAHIVIHGILHLLGFDHKKNIDRINMELLEINYLFYLGFKNPYLSS